MNGDAAREIERALRPVDFSTFTEIEAAEEWGWRHTFGAAAFSLVQADLAIAGAVSRTERLWTVT